MTSGLTGFPSHFLRFGKSREKQKKIKLKADALARHPE
jgi:hypothetical protein